MANHTPGPWRICPDTPLVVESFGYTTKAAPLWAGDGPIAPCDSPSQKWVATICKHDIPPIEREANAHLIAAAPEILEVLNAVYAGCVNTVTGDRLVLNISREAFEGIEAVIAKAEGVSRG